jgi:hypothetical protein
LNKDYRKGLNVKYMNASTVYTRVDGLRVDILNFRGFFCKTSKASRHRAHEPPMLRIFWCKQSPAVFRTWYVRTHSSSIDLPYPFHGPCHVRKPLALWLLVFAQLPSLV